MQEQMREALNKSAEELLDDFAAERVGVDSARDLPHLDIPFGRIVLSLQDWPVDRTMTACGFVKVNGTHGCFELYARKQKAGRWVVDAIGVGENYADVRSLSSLRGPKPSLKRRIAAAVLPLLSRWAQEHTREFARRQEMSYQHLLEAYSGRRGEDELPSNDFSPCVLRANVRDHHEIMSSKFKAACEATTRAADRYRREIDKLASAAAHELRGAH